MFADLQLQQILAASSALEQFQRQLYESGDKTLYITGAAIAQIVWNFQLQQDPDFSLDAFETVEVKNLTDTLALAVPAFAVAVKLRPHQIDVIAPVGLKDLFNQRIRPNKKQMTQLEYEKLCARIAAHWPSVQIDAWADSTEGGGHRHTQQGCCD